MSEWAKKIEDRLRSMEGELAALRERAEASLTKRDLADMGRRLDHADFRTITVLLTESPGAAAAVGAVSAPKDGTYFLELSDPDIPNGLAFQSTSTVAVDYGTPGAVKVAVPNGGITYAKIQDVSANDKVLGRFSGGSGNVEEIACTSAGRAIIDDADAAAQRTTLGLGSIATHDTTEFADIVHGSSHQPLGADPTFASQSGWSAGTHSTKRSLANGDSLSDTQDYVITLVADLLALKWPTA